jgi:ABC-2 type transport system ATP-binding protein
VIIISQGKLVATDSVANLTNRLRGAEAVAVEIESDGQTVPIDVQGRLEQVSGVSRVISKEPRNGRWLFEVESVQGRSIRADLARAVVGAGWNLTELRAVGFSLEDIFLQLTAAEKAEKTEQQVKQEEKVAQ